MVKIRTVREETPIKRPLFSREAAGCTPDGGREGDPICPSQRMAVEQKLIDSACMVASLRKFDGLARSAGTAVNFA